MKITTVSLVNNTPINTGGKTVSFFVNSVLGEEHDILFLYFDKREDEKGFSPKEINFTQIHIPIKSYVSFIPDKIKKLFLDIFFQKHLFKDMKTDIVLLEFPYLYHIAKIISQFNNNCPIYLLEHNIEWQFYKNHGSKVWRIIKMFEEYVLKNVDKVITISPADYNFLLNKNFNKNIFLIDPGVLNTRFNFLGNIESFTQDTVNILFYGTIHNNPTNMQALDFISNDLSKILPDTYLLHICGNVNPYNNTNNIIFHGLVNNIEDYIKKSDVVIAPIANGAGVKIRILESLYCGKIVLASKNALEGLNPVLKNVVIECNTPSDYLQELEKLRTDVNYKTKQELHVQQAVYKYKAGIESHIHLIFSR